MRVLLLAVALDLKDEEIGLAYIASYLKNAGYENKLISINAAEVNYAQIEEYNPDIIGVCLYSYVINEVSSIVEECRKRLPDVKIIYGGYFPSYCYQEILAEPIHPDYVLIGEGEEYIVELLMALEGKGSLEEVKNVAYMKDGEVFLKRDKIQITDKMCSVYPDRGVIEDFGLNSAKIFFARTSMFCFDELQYREEDNVVGEITSIHEKYEVNRFDILDNGLQEPSNINFYLNIFKKVRQTCDVYFYLNVSEKFLETEDKLLCELEKSGLIGLHIDLQYKNYDLNAKEYLEQVQAYKRFYDICKEYRFALSTYIPFIRYDYTLDILRQNLELLGYCKIALEINMELMEEPLKHTPLHEQLRKRGYICQDEESLYFGVVKFSDERVREFYIFIKYVIDKYYDVYLLSKMYQYTIEYRNLIAFYIRNDFGERINKLVNQYLEDVEEKTEKWSNTRVECYSMILDKYAECKDFDSVREQCEDIFIKYVNLEELREEIQQLEKQRMKIVKRILVSYGEKMI